MLPPEDARLVLTRLFRRRHVVDLQAILATLKTSSPMTAFRRLAEVGSLSSYSHRGRYYTVPDIPTFDDDGLWLHQGIGFSRHGTLKDTVPVLVDRSEAGMVHRDLQVRLQVRVHNTLLELVQAHRLVRDSLAGEYLYLSAEPDRTRVQRQRRESMKPPVALEAGPPPTALVVEILIEVIHAAAVRGDPQAIAARLATRGVIASVEQVERVLREHRLLGKKTAPSRSRRSRR
jgi:hypothetical protein